VNDAATITQLLIAHREGDRDAFDRLVPLVYADLSRIARGQLARHRRHATLDTCAVVHEAYLKLVAQAGVQWEGRRHFFAVASRAMRQVIVDRARRRSAAKRGGGLPPLPLDAVEIPVDDSAATLLALNRALEGLEKLDERLVRVVECRFFAGLTEEETAEALEVSVRTVQRDWRKARAWLLRELSHERGVESSREIT